MYDDQHSPRGRTADTDVSRFGLGVIPVGECDQKWIVESSLRFLETDVVLSDVFCGFLLVPFERQSHVEPRSPMFMSPVPASAGQNGDNHHFRSVPSSSNAALAARIRLFFLMCLS
jgi:hypothetical protein